MKTNIISLALVVVSTLFCLPVFSQINEAAPQREVEYEEEYKFRDFRFAIGGGYAYREGTIEKTNNQVVDDMNKKLRHGFTIDADAQYFFKQIWGLGLNANMSSFSTSNNGSFSIPDFEGTVHTYNETQRIIYIGPSYALRKESEKFILLGTIGFGPLFYMSNMTLNGFEVNGTKTTFGTNISLSGEYKMNNKMALGLKLSSTGGTIDSMDVQGQSVDTGKNVSLANIGVSVFLSFRSW